MKLDDVYLVGAPTTRTKAYLQILGQNGLMPGKCLIMSKDAKQLEEERSSYVEPNDEIRYFNEKEPVLYTLEKYDIKYEVFPSENINDPEMIECIGGLSCNYLIYSGYGGQLLRPQLFEFGKRFLHAHAGVLPTYRGSTTVYYSMLEENCCGASVIFLSRGIDEGDLITVETFPIPAKDVNMDYIYEPYTRACTLLKALKEYINLGYFPTKEQEIETADTYYIIHPVLKHIAIMHQE